MTEVIDFEVERMKREVAGDCRLDMPDGSVWYKFFADYHFQASGVGLSERVLQSLPDNAVLQDGKFTIEFWAQSQEEAERRVKAMRESLGEPSQIYEVVPA